MMRAKPIAILMGRQEAVEDHHDSNGPDPRAEQLTDFTIGDVKLETP